LICPTPTAIWLQHGLDGDAKSTPELTSLLMDLVKVNAKSSFEAMLTQARQAAEVWDLTWKARALYPRRHCSSASAFAHACPRYPPVQIIAGQVAVPKDGGKGFKAPGSVRPFTFLAGLEEADRIAILNAVVLGGEPVAQIQHRATQIVA
jgi:hypothetical protein